MAQKFNYEEYHKEIDGVLYKKCSLHKELFHEESEWMPATLEYFYINKQNQSDGLHPWCKRCSRVKAKNRKRRNREKCLEQDKKYYKDNKEKVDIQQKEYRKNNHEKRLKCQRSWANKEGSKERFKLYTKKHNQKSHLISEKEWIACKEYFKDEDGDYCCAYCGLKIQNHFRLHKGKLKHQDLHREHVDHNGSRKLDNCVPSCGNCNSKKHDSEFEDWYNTKNPVFSQEKLNKIHKWINEDSKKFIEIK